MKYKTRKIMVERWVIVEAESDVRVSGEFDTQLEAENELELWRRIKIDAETSIQDLGGAEAYMLAVVNRNKL